MTLSRRAGGVTCRPRSADARAGSGASYPQSPGRGKRGGDGPGLPSLSVDSSRPRRLTGEFGSCRVPPMRRRARQFGVLLVATCVCAGSIPCLEGAGASVPCPASMHDASPPAHAAQRAGGDHADHGAHDAAPHEMRAPCPCGCCELPDADANAARIGYALASALPGLATPEMTHAVSRPAHRACPAHPSPLEHVPLLS